MNEEFRPNSIDPRDTEIEVRLMALISGESSEFERDQLLRLLERNPELLPPYHQLQRLHEILMEVGSGDLVDEGDDWRLSPDRRGSVLSVLSGEAENPWSPSAEVEPKISRNWMDALPFFNGRPKIVRPRVAQGKSIEPIREPRPLTPLAGRAGAVRGWGEGFSDKFLLRSRYKIALMVLACILLCITLLPISQLAESQVASVAALAGLSDRMSVADRTDSEFAAGSSTRAFRETLSVDGMGLPESGPTFSSDAFDFESRSNTDPRTSLSEIENALVDNVAPERYYRYDTPKAQPESTILFPEQYGGRPTLPYRPKSSEPATLEKSSTAPDFDSAWKLAELDEASMSVTDSYASDKALAQDPRSLTRDASTPPAQTIEMDFARESEPLLGKSLSFSGEETGSLGLRVGQGFGGGSQAAMPADDANQPLAANASGNSSGRSKDDAAFADRRAGQPLDPSDALTLPRFENQSHAGYAVPFGRQQGPVESGQTDTNEALRAARSTSDLSRDQLQLEGRLSADQSSAIAAPTGEPDSSLAFADKSNRELSELAGGLQSIPETPSVFSEPNHRQEFNRGKRLGWEPQSVVSEALDEQLAATDPFSTFSLHVSDVSFKLTLAALAQGEWPDAQRIRLEEFVNAFDYLDPLPGNDESIVCRMEQAIHPFLQQRNLLRVSMRTAASGRATPLRLTMLIDNSGSMERPDRRQTLLRAFAALTRQLHESDQVTLISFARTPRLLADRITGDQSGSLVPLIDILPSEGGTNFEAALLLGIEKAREQYTPQAQNRIVLFTDGAVNLGDANPEGLSEIVTRMRDAGIAFDAAGISAQDLNDEVLEALTREGDGRYYLLDSSESVEAGFAEQIAGALRPSAKNVKVQVQFNPQRVDRFKLLGFEKYQLNQEDFRNDQVDAAEMAASEAGVAMYHFQAKPEGMGDIGRVSVRFQDIATGQMVERSWPIPFEPNPPRIDQANPSLRIAAAAALLAARLRGEPTGESVDLKSLAKLVAELPERERRNQRVQQLLTMIEQARRIGGTDGE